MAATYDHRTWAPTERALPPASTGSCHKTLAFSGVQRSHRLAAKMMTPSVVVSTKLPPSVRTPQPQRSRCCCHPGSRSCNSWLAPILESRQRHIDEVRCGLALAEFLVGVDTAAGRPTGLSSTAGLFHGEALDQSASLEVPDALRNGPTTPPDSNSDSNATTPSLPTTADGSTPSSSTPLDPLTKIGASNGCSPRPRSRSNVYRTVF